MIVLTGLRLGVQGLEFAPDAKSLLARGWGEVAAWRLPGGSIHTRSPDYCRATFTPEGDLLVVRYRRMTAELGRQALAPGAEFQGVAIEREFAVPRPFRLSPDGGRVVAIRVPPGLRWWSYPDLQPLPDWKQPFSVEVTYWDLAFSPDGKAVAAFHPLGVSTHDATTGDLRWWADVPTVQATHSIAWSPDGRYIAAGQSKRVLVFDASDGRTIHELEQSRKHFLDLEFTRDGRFLATVSNEKTVKFFDTGSWSLRHELAWDVGGLRAIAFSHNGMLAAAGGGSKKVVVWDLDL
jgi:WD40 repeat protein